MKTAETEASKAVDKVSAGKVQNSKGVCDVGQRGAVNIPSGSKRRVELRQADPGFGLHYAPC